MIPIVAITAVSRQQQWDTGGETSAPKAISKMIKVTGSRRLQGLGEVVLDDVVDLP